MYEIIYMYRSKYVYRYVLYRGDRGMCINKSKEVVGTVKGN